jgi:hypothetical protein
VLALVTGLAVLLGGATTLQPASADSGLPSQQQWEEDVAHVMAGSHTYLRKAISGGHARYAINLDIDNTSVATHYDPGHAIHAVRAFARFAKSKGVAVLFNTGRRASHLKAARKLVRKAGYPLTRMCGRQGPKETLAHGKKRCRARFIRAGYTIVANVGNNPTDFSGPKNYGRAFRLPNYGGLLG